MKSLLFVGMSIKNYFIARNYKPKVVEKQFREISKLLRAEARQIKPKQQANDRILFAITYNPMLPNLRGLIKKHLPVLHSGSDLKTCSRKILSLRFLREINILKKYYFYHLS